MIAVGRISRSVGLKGEMSVIAFSDNLQRFGKLRTVWVGAEETRVAQHSVEATRLRGSSVVLKLKDVESRSAAELLRGLLVFVAPEESVAPAKGSYFIHEIVGMTVVTESGREVGTVREVLQLPANDVWVVAGAGREFLIPAIKDVIRSVNGQQRRITIYPMEGLLE